MNDLMRRREQLAGMAAYLAERREIILLAWREAVQRDPELTTVSSISRLQFVDHIPEVLDGFERQLRGVNPEEIVQARSDEREGAAGHGLHRWQQGYDQRGTMREWGHLHVCLLDEIERFRTLNALPPDMLALAARALVQLCNAGVCESTTRYFEMQRMEAASRVRDLEQALRQLKALEQQRAEAWREAAHDLRGSVSVITNVTSLLNRDGTTDPTRSKVSRMLECGVASLHELLTDLMDLARLEAGHERRNLTHFDAARVLREYCDSLRPLAAERNLFLKTEGPDSLPVEGDRAKVQRIAQNLVLNALKVTERGDVRVIWSESGAQGEQWALCVQDTGPGFAPASAAPVSRALKHATEVAHEAEDRAELDGSFESVEHAPTLPSQTPNGTREPHGEGIGLSIVKRLCELLDAGVEMESAAGKGTTFRVTFPRRYPST